MFLTIYSVSPSVEIIFLQNGQRNRTWGNGLVKCGTFSNLERSHLFVILGFYAQTEERKDRRQQFNLKAFSV